MTKFNIRHVQHHLAEVREAVERGEKARITRPGKVVAQLGPPEPASSTPAWPDSGARFQRFVALRSDEIPASRIIDDDRQERF